MLTAVAIIVGFILDMFLGDPHWLPHPISLMGRVIAFLEKTIRPLCRNNPGALFLGGSCLTVLLAGGSYWLVYVLLAWAGNIHPYLRFACETVMFYQLFAVRCLREESGRVYAELKKGSLPEARYWLSRIVGRDTADLSSEEVTKAAVETVAENTTDGVIAPMLYMFIGGAPLAFAYKAINTLDSMIGYKNERYLFFGRFAAKTDDLVNFLPARLAALFMIITTYFGGYDYRNAWYIFRRDRYNHLSPNSAQTESVCAGALNICLGGGHYYFGKFVPKATIGDARRKAEPEDIKRVGKLMFYTALLALAIFSCVNFSILFLRNGGYV